MKSRWFRLKATATSLRKRGFSIRDIEHRLGIARSTLSGWFKTIKLTGGQKEKIMRDWKKALSKARGRAVLWHNAQKEKRLLVAEAEALKTFQGIDIKNKDILELALAILYLGEGSKKNTETALGSSDPLMMKFFLAVLLNIYKLDVQTIRCELGLRADQDPLKMKRFWSKVLQLPLSNFRQVNVDKRTIGSRTYPSYKGVCQIRCGNVAIQRKLVYLANLFCKKAVEHTKGLIVHR